MRAGVVAAAVMVGVSQASVPQIPAAPGFELATVRATTVDGQIRVQVPVGWHHAWSNARNHDAVWVFAKVKVAQVQRWRHARLLSAASESASLSCATSADGVGAFCRPATTHRGPLSGEVTLTLDPEQFGPRERTLPLEVRAYALEMVHVPAGAFFVGDADPQSVAHAALFRSKASGEHAGPYPVTSEAEIDVSPTAGALYYRARSAEYQGDARGPIPAAFPKGTREFYVMKYEVTQGQYAAFLNTVSAEATSFRSVHGGVSPGSRAGYYESRGTIRLVDGWYRADRPDRPANWVSWDDGLAFADWAGLRPMTELEFTKAARGPDLPVARDFPWGTDSAAQLIRRLQPDGDLAVAGDADVSRLSDSTRALFGASYYWVMDLAGSLWERVVSLGHPRGRAFRGTHGDGELAKYGIATNTDWPAGDHDPGGYGYRGGGHYETARPAEYNPLSWRDFGSWGGGPRSIAYGFRAVRTVDR